MHILDLFTILCVGLMTGNELAMSLFVNPAIWRLKAPSGAEVLSILARVLGKWMPPWYVISMVLLMAEAYVRRHGAHVHLLYGAVVLLAASIGYSIAFLVPINNQIARLDAGSPTAGWKEEHTRWDMLHRWRIAMLVGAMALLIWGVVA